jgi:hypothetical protein
VKRLSVRKGGSKQKGAAFERDICKQFSLWLSQGERDDLFWRSAMSGGRATIGYKEGKKRNAQAGDITPISQAGARWSDRYAIECKHYQTLEFTPLCTSNKGNVQVFWKQARRDAFKADKNPILIMKQNHYPILMGSYLTVVKREFLLDPLIELPRLNLAIITLEEFFKEVPADVV